MRQTGRTAKQLLSAPRDSVFVWVNGNTSYPMGLAKLLGRDDLKIVSPTWLENDGYRGVSLTGVIVDHAASLTDRQIQALQYAGDRVREVE